MTDLRKAFEEDGHANVTTYIASGNVLFESDAPKPSLEARLEKALERRFGTPLVVVVRSRPQLRTIVDKAPEGFGRQPTKFHSDVLFLKSPLSPRRAIEAIELRDGVDKVWPGPGVVYLARLSARLTQSKIAKFAATPEYRLVTIRSWNTATKLRALLDG